MARGNQREQARAKTQKANELKAKQQKKEGTPASRNLSDSARLAAKVAAKKEMEAKQAGQEAVTAVPKKSVKKSSTQPSPLDDLLSVGLKSSKKK